MPAPKRAALCAAPFTALLGAILSGALLALAGCADLQILPANECGNGVLEPGEACDGEADCGAPGAEHACQILCSSGACREGYACGLDGVCQAPSGTFESSSATATSTVLDLFTGDVNRDGCSELYVTKRQSITLMAFESAKPGACPAHTQEIAAGRTPDKDLTRPAAHLADMNRDGRPDVVRAAEAQYGDALFVDLAGPAPAVASILYPTVKALESPVRSLRVTFQSSDALLLFIDRPKGEEMIGVVGVLDPQNTPSPAGTGLPGVMEDLAFVVAANTNKADPACNPCDEVLFGFAGQGQIAALHLSKGMEPASGEDAIVATMPAPVITLPPGAKLRKSNASIAVVDHDGDGHLDVIVNSEAPTPMGKSPLYIAYGTGKGTFHSTSPPDLAAPDGKASQLVVDGPDSMDDATAGDAIFVAADFDGDGKVDVVPVPCPPSAALESIACNATAATGCEAVVVDIDRDGRPDIVSTEEQQPGLFVRRPSSAGGFHVSFVDTSCPPHELATGDFDDDGNQDLAFFDQTLQASAVSGSEGTPVDTLMVSYGNAFASSGAPLASGQFADARGLVSGRFSPGAATTQLYATRLLDETAKSGFSLVEGYGERRLFAPYYLPYTGATGPGNPNIQPVAMVSGTSGLFGQDDAGQPASAVALVTRDEDVDPPATPVLRLVDARSGASSLTQAVNGESPDCDGCVLVPIRVPECAGADEADQLLLLGADKLIVYSVVTIAGPADTEVRAFAMCDSFDAGKHTFSFVDAEPRPERYVPRPIVADLDGDGRPDVLARDAAGAMVVLWSQPGGGFEPVELPFPERLSATRCGGKCSVALAEIEGSGTGAGDLLVAAPGGLTRYRPRKDRTFEELPVPAGLAEVTIADDTDFTSIVASDFDGDGLEDIALMPSSTLLVTLRAVPEEP